MTGAHQVSNKEAGQCQTTFNQYGILKTINRELTPF
jgi:hypothetical protein